MPKEINSVTDNSNTIKEITSVIGICKVCILGHGEYVLISHSIPKQIKISLWAQAKLHIVLDSACYSHQGTFILSKNKCLLSVYLDLISTVLSIVPFENMLWLGHGFALNRAFLGWKKKKKWKQNCHFLVIMLECK